MPLTTLIIDLDDTLYPASAGVWQAIRQRIDAYIRHKFNVSAEEAVRLRDDLFQKYGTTMRGLQVVYHLDEEDYLSYVHDVPLEQFLAPNPALRKMLHGLPYRKVILTNADQRHAERVTGILGITECFEQVIDVRALSPYCKPMPEAFEIVLRLLDLPAMECVLVEDSLANLGTAKRMGFSTVRIGNSADCHHCDATIESILELEQVLERMNA